jgi:hypothetical protein
MPHGDMRVKMNKARVAEAARGTYPIGTEILEIRLLSIIHCFQGASLASSQDVEMTVVHKHSTDAGKTHR